MLRDTKDRPGYDPPPPSAGDARNSSSESEDGFPTILETGVEDLSVAATTTKSAAVKMAAAPGPSAAVPNGPPRNLSSSGNFFFLLTFLNYASHIQFLFLFSVRQR